MRRMPRVGRELSKTGIYHVMLRGNERREIFMEIDIGAVLLSTNGASLFTFLTKAVSKNKEDHIF
jgi:hypothetical protein